MGCCSSALASDINEMNSTLNGYYAAKSYQRRSYKWNYFSQISSGSSSGVSSACNSPPRRSILSRFNSTPSSTQPDALRAKAPHFTMTPKSIPIAFEMLPICDDFGEAAKMQQHQENRSVGYYSESMSANSSVSTQSQACLVRAQDTSLRPDSPMVALTPAHTDLEMEMYMMSRSHGLMPKTSSPIFQRKNVTFNAVASASPPSHSYQKWASYLQTTPTYMLHNITDIPEAIAGHFSPLDFPAFTDLEDMESAAKRFKLDIIPLASKAEVNEAFYQKPIPKSSSAKHVITTDL